jgi:hypothetical protein
MHLRMLVRGRRHLRGAQRRTKTFARYLRVTDVRGLAGPHGGRLGPNVTNRARRACAPVPGETAEFAVHPQRTTARNRQADARCRRSQRHESRAAHRNRRQFRSDLRRRRVLRLKRNALRGSEMRYRVDQGTGPEALSHSIGARAPIGASRTSRGYSVRWSAHRLRGSSSGCCTRSSDLWRRQFERSDPLNRQAEGAGILALSSIGHGAAANVAGGLPFSVVMVQTGQLSRVAQLVGAPSSAAGFFVHLAISVLIGRCVPRARAPAPRASVHRRPTPANCGCAGAAPLDADARANVVFHRRRDVAPDHS